MNSKNIYLYNANQSFSRTDRYLYDVLKTEGFNIKKTFYVRSGGGAER